MGIGLAFINGFVSFLCIIEKLLKHGTEILVFMPDGIKRPVELEILNFQAEQLTGVQFVHDRDSGQAADGSLVANY